MNPPCFLFSEGIKPQELFFRIKRHELVWKAARMDYVSPIQFYGRTVIENFSEIPGIPISTIRLASFLTNNHFIVGGTRGSRPGGTGGTTIWTQHIIHEE